MFYLGGDQPAVSWVERFRSVFGAFLGLMLMLLPLNTLVNLRAWMSGEWSPWGHALLVFALPQNPMAQPWAVIAGNTLPALVGISVIHLVGNPILAMLMAASLSILGMFILGCLHPPSSSGSFNRSFGALHAIPLCFSPSYD